MGESGQGGGLYNEVTGAATIVDTVVSNNTVISGPTAVNSRLVLGAGVYNAGGLTLEAGSVDHNATKQSNTALGGGIYNTGTVSVNGSEIRDNVAFRGGGVYNLGGTVTLVNVAVDGNSANSDGGVYSNGSLTVSEGEIVGNSAHAFGGIYNGLRAYIVGCTIGGNESTTADAGGVGNDGNMTMDSCIIQDNSADSLIPVVHAGGILNTGTLTVRGSTISGNISSIDGGGIYNSGTLTLTNFGNVRTEILLNHASSRRWPFQLRLREHFQLHDWWRDRRHESGDGRRRNLQCRHDEVDRQWDRQ